MNQFDPPTNVGSNDGLGVIERLRLIAAWHTPGGPTPKHKPDKQATCAEAADEIERMRQTDERDRQSRGMFVARLEKLQESGDRLTAAEVLALLSDCDMLASQAECTGDQGVCTYPHCACKPC
jgi:hypothetical protein